LADRDVERRARAPTPHLARSRRHRQAASARTYLEGVDHIRRRLRLHHLETRTTLRSTHRRSGARAAQAGDTHVGFLLAAVSRRSLSLTRTPRVWVVVSDKAGDNAQVDAVVERLPWPVEYRRLTFKKPFRRGKPPFFAS